LFDNPKLKSAKLTLEARLIGLLRSHKTGGSAEVGNAGARRYCHRPGGNHSLAMTPREVAGGDNLSINDRQGPLSVPVTPGPYTLRQTFGLSAAHARSLNSVKRRQRSSLPTRLLTRSGSATGNRFTGP